MNKGTTCFAGFFSQWILDTAVFMIGMIVYAYKGFPQFYPLAMLGGVFWGIGKLYTFDVKKMTRHFHSPHICKCLFFFFFLFASY